MQAAAQIVHLHHVPAVRAARTLNRECSMFKGGPSMRAFLIAALFGLGIAALMLALAPQGPPTIQAQPGRAYVGSEKCASCHADLGAWWKRTLHSKMVRPATPDQIKADLRAPNAPNLSEFDFAYVIGGWYKEERYVIRRGDELLTTPHEWDAVPARFVIRRAASGEPEFLNWRSACIGCHTTGYSPQSRQWTELNIGCESCHGPGSAHAAAPTKANILIDRTAEACGSCHIRGTDNATRFGFPTTYRLGQPQTLLAGFTPIPMTDAGSIFPDQRTSNRHRQQFIDYAKSRHYVNARMGCVSCHDPHVGTEGAARTQLRKPKSTLCSTCHTSQGKAFVRHTGHQPWQLTCTDCHNPRVIADGTISTHTFRTLPPADAVRLGPRQANSCTYKCHKTQSAEWAQLAVTQKGIGR
jgi:predicted CXXCH cytochrome family protein